MITLKVRTASWSIRSSRETRKVTTVLLVLSFSYNLSSVFFLIRFRGLTPLTVTAFFLLARGAMLRATDVAIVSTGLSSTVRESERCRASTRAIRRWETSSGAPETGLEHCAWSPSARGCWAREAPTRKEASRGAWVVDGGMGEGAGAVRAGAHGGAARADAWRGGRVRGWGEVGPPAGVLTAWEGRVCVA